MSDPLPPARRTGGPPRRTLVGPFTGRQVLALVVTLVAVAGVLAVVTAPVATVDPARNVAVGASFVPFSQAVEGLRIGNVAPELAAADGSQQLLDLSGRPIRLADLRGRPVWINFFASWCPPCQSETPTIERVFETHRAQGLAVIGVSVQETSPDDVRAYAATYGLQYTIGFDGTSAVYKAFHVFGLPTQLFLDRNGIVRAVVNGPLTQLQAEQILAPLLEPAATAPVTGTSGSPASPSASAHP